MSRLDENRRENCRRLGLDAAVLSTGDGPVENIHLGKSSAGVPFLEVQGKNLYAPSAPREVVEREVEGLLAGQDPELVVFFGLGLGWHLQAIAARCRVPMLVFEPDQEILSAVLAFAPLELSRTTVVTTAEALRARLDDFLGGRPRRLIAGALPPWAELRPRAFGEFRQVLQETLQQVESDHKTRHRFSEEWVRNMAANLPFLGTHRSLDALGDGFAGKPAILVGAGPSLDHTLPTLAQVRGRALILAVHTAVPALSRAGVTPDMAIILEGQKLDHYFLGLEDLAEMVLLPSPQTHPAHLAVDFGDFIGFSHEGNAAADWLQEAYGIPALRSGGSVACAAFSILHHLGCDPIILTGMDLAYGEDRGHASGADTGCCSAVFDRENGKVTTHCSRGVHASHTYSLEEVPAWGGQGTALSRPALSTFRLWFEAAGRSWGRGPRLINATEGGAHIRGFEDRPLAEVLDEQGPLDPAPALMLRQALAAAAPRDPRPLVRTVGRELDAIRQAREEARRALAAVDPALKLLKARRLDRVQPRLDELAAREKKLQEATRRTRLLNTLVGHRARDVKARPAGNDPVGKTIASLEASAAISRLVVHGAEELLTLFEPALERLTGGGEER